MYTCRPMQFHYYYVYLDPVQLMLSSHSFGVRQVRGPLEPGLCSGSWVGPGQLLLAFLVFGLGRSACYLQSSLLPHHNFFVLQEDNAGVWTGDGVTVMEQ